MTRYVREKVERIETPWVAWALVGVVACLLLAYAYFLSGAVSNMVVAKDMRAEIVALTSATSGLESEYLAKKSSLDLAYARSIGFTESNEALYIAKRPSAPLSLNR